MKVPILYLFLLSAVFAISCENAGKGPADDSSWIEDTTIFRQSTEGAALTHREEDFLSDLLEMNFEQLIWLQNGVRFGSDEGLKMHAKKMLDDHKKMDSLYKAFAIDRNADLEPIDSNKEFYLDEPIGNEWNEEWADVIKERHQRLIKRFERADKHIRDSTLRALNTQHLPILQSHRDIAAQLEEQFDKK